MLYLSAGAIAGAFGGRMKKRQLGIVALSATVGVLLLLFLPLGGPEISMMPEYPEVVTTPGTYHLDERRFIEVRERDGTIEYYEGELLSVSEDQDGPDHVTATIDQVVGLIFEAGWSVGFEPPSTILLDSGSGDLTRRDFGDRAGVETDLSTVTRAPAEPSPGSLAEAIKRNAQTSKEDEAEPNE